MACIAFDTTGTLEGHFWRAFNLNDYAAGDFTVCEVQIGVEQVDAANYGITLNLYTSSTAFPPGTLTLIGTASATLHPSDSRTIVSVPLAASVPAGARLVLEVIAPAVDNNFFFFGANSSAQTAPSYLSAPACGISVPTDTEALDFISHWVMNIVGTDKLGSTATALRVDAPAATLAVSGDGVLEIGEAATVSPSWTNSGTNAYTLSGTATNAVGPGISLVKNTAAYGLLGVGATKSCGTDCYTIRVNGPRGVQHLDVTFDEDVTPVMSAIAAPDALPTKTWTLHVGESFTDVSSGIVADPYYPFIETIFHKGVTGGCRSGAEFCPTAGTLRQEMAVFLLKSKFGAGYAPPACAHHFTDVPCPATPAFPYSDFVEDLYARGITAGCQSHPGFVPPVFCPGSNALRQEMAVFLLKTSMGPAYKPPACTSHFTDVPCPATASFPYSDWIEALFNLGITGGCQSDPGFNPPVFCPTASVLRQEMAVFLTRTFGLALYGP